MGREGRGGGDGGEILKEAWGWPESGKAVRCSHGVAMNLPYL